MDHVPMPADPMGPRLQVPYLGMFTYDSRGFLTYPIRVNVVTGPTSPNHNCLFLVRHGELLPAASFIQAWLWFGLLGEAVGAGVQPNGQIVSLKPSLFLKKRGNRDYLCTEHLVSMLEKGKTKFTHESDNRAGNDDHIHGLVRSLEGARVYLHRVSHDFLKLRNNKIFYPNRKDEIDTVGLIVFSCALLWQTIYNVYGIGLHPKVGVANKSTSLTHNPPLSLVDEILRQSGWKDKEIERMPRDVVFRYQLAFYRGNRELIGHNNVLPEDAVVVYRHIKHDCACQAIEIDPSIATSHNGTTLFRYDPLDLTTEEVLHSQPVFLDASDNGTPYQSPPYVAVLCIQPAAEPRGRLPVGPIQICKLEMIQNYTNQLLGPSFPPGVPRCFWVDPRVLSSLRGPINHSIPTSPVQFPNVFSQARYVLVIDPWLSENTPPECSNAEKLIRIRWSNWKDSIIALLQSSQVEPSQLFFLFGVKGDSGRNTTHCSTVVSLESLYKGLSQENENEGQKITAPPPGFSHIAVPTPAPQTATTLQPTPMPMRQGGNLTATLPARVVRSPFYRVVVPSRTPTPEPAPAPEPSRKRKATESREPSPAPNPNLEKKTLPMFPQPPYCNPVNLIRYSDRLLKNKFLPRFQKDLNFLFRHLQAGGGELIFAGAMDSHLRRDGLIKTLLTMLRVSVMTLSHFRIFAEYVGAGAVVCVFKAFQEAYGATDEYFVPPGNDVGNEADVALVLERLGGLEKMWLRMIVRDGVKN